MPVQTIHVAVVGVGLVGSELVSQLLSLPSPSPFRLISLSSSRRTLFVPDGITSQSWKSDLEASPISAEIPNLLQGLSELVIKQRKRVVLVDNTSDEGVANSYPDFLKYGISVVTPNKKAYSGDLGLYNRIAVESAAGGSSWLHESTVGAGLPIISTLKDLVATGDKVTKIEGVFSGTLSYIFNEFSTGSHTGKSFSSIVSIARENGFTEPHPGDDLNGADVARKLTILSRLIPSLQTALPQGYKSVSITSLVPDALADSPDGDDFIRRLPEHDAHYDKLRSDAAAEGAVLRYVGVIDVQSGTIKAALEKYPKTHAFATSLGGSDNIVMFYTERYGARPLIIQGAGAGAAVTAMGVLSDLLKLI